MWYVDQHPDDVESLPAAERRAEERPGQVPLTRLPFHRVVLSGDGGIRGRPASG
jgi:hypothetical protein